MGVIYRNDFQTACSKRQATGALKKSLNRSARAHFLAGQNLFRKPATALGSSPRAGFFEDHALLKIPRLAALRRTRRRGTGCRIAEAAPEQPREEVAAVVLIAALIVATLVVAWRHRGDATTIAFAAIDPDFRQSSVPRPARSRSAPWSRAVQCLRGIRRRRSVDERRLVGQMHRQVVQGIECPALPGRRSSCECAPPVNHPAMEWHALTILISLSRESEMDTNSTAAICSCARQSG